MSCRSTDRPAAHTTAQIHRRHDEDDNNDDTATMAAANRGCRRFGTMATVFGTGQFAICGFTVRCGQVYENVTGNVMRASRHCLVRKVNWILRFVPRHWVRIAPISTRHCRDRDENTSISIAFFDFLPQQCVRCLRCLTCGGLQIRIKWTRHLNRRTSIVLNGTVIICSWCLQRKLNW